MNDQIHDLCKKIAQERNPEKVKELTEQLHFALSEHTLQLQNNAAYTSYQVQEHSQTKMAT